MSAGIRALAGRRVGILGMARSGLAAARALRALDAEVLAFDDKPAALAEVAALGARPGDLRDVASLDCLIASPGVPLTHPAPHPVIAAAQAAGVRLTCDIDLFVAPLRAAGHKLVGVTGTNGKSTTAALIHHLLGAAGMPSLLGGNIGKPVLDLALPAAPATIVLELSSFQLDLCTSLRPDVALWLNLSPDHLDRHGDLDGYIRAKRRIFANMTFEDHAVIGIDDAPGRAIADLAARCCRVVRFGTHDEADYRIVDGALLHGDRPVCRLDDLERLRGAHNWQNAAAAVAALRCLGIDETALVRGLASFQGLPHRMEEVARRGVVRFVNDSKATNPDAAIRSLVAFPRIHWIAGGKPKPGGFAELLPHLGGVAHAYLIGEAADALEATLEGHVPTSRHASMVEALESAASAAGRDEARDVTVLLAPACASFDQFKSFEERGDMFRDAARAIAGRSRQGAAA